MANIRNRVMKDDAFKNEIDSCIKPVTDLLGITLGRLSWKEKQINIHEGASEAEIDSMNDTLKNLEPNFDKKEYATEPPKKLSSYSKSP